MRLNWATIDRWREEAGLSKSELARKSGVPENTIHRGVKFNSTLQPTTIVVIRSLFPEKFNDRGDVAESAPAVIETARRGDVQ